MKELDFLFSPYLLELPLSCMGNNPSSLQEFIRSGVVLLLDIMSNEVYLVDRVLVGKKKRNDAACPLPECSPFDKNDDFCAHSYYGIEIEINSHCNYKCGFCPVAFGEQSVGFMSLLHYQHIISEAISCGIKNVSLNHYSEPTLHPELVEMVALAARQGLGITLFTNASGLTNKVIQGLAEFKYATEVVVNFSESNAHDYQQATQSKLFSKVVSQINEAAKLLSIKVVVNNPSQGIVNAIARLFPDVLVQQWETDDRAGLLDVPNYGNHQWHRGQLLNGCALAARFINVSIDGDVFLCAQDYYKSNVIGNIHNKSLRAILEGDTAQQYRRWVFGVDSPPKDFICRRCQWTRPKTEGFSIGQPMTDYDLEVYSEIVRSADIIKVFTPDQGVKKLAYREFKND